MLFNKPTGHVVSIASEFLFKNVRSYCNTFCCFFLLTAHIAIKLSSRIIAAHVAEFV